MEGSRSWMSFTKDAVEVTLPPQDGLAWPTLPPGVGDSPNKARPKRKPRPKKSQRGKRG